MAEGKRIVVIEEDMSGPTTTELVDVHCPFCKCLAWRATHMGSQVPHPGALAFCKGCGGVSVFTDRNSQRRGLALRRPNYDEVHGIDHNRQIGYWKARFRTAIN